MEKIKIPFPLDVFLDITEAYDLSLTNLNEEEKALYDQIEDTKKENIKFLGRNLTDDEESQIENSFEGGAALALKIADLHRIALDKVKSSNNKVL